jgi:peroxidase
MREHNSWVDTLKSQHPDWSAAQLYNMAKSITTAEYQNIIYQEYLPVLIGDALKPYNGYDPTVNAQATQEFSTAAFRVGHSQVSDTQTGLDNNLNVVFTESLAEAFFNTPEIDEQNGINPLIRTLGVDSSQATDVYTVAALRNLLFAGLVGGEINEIDLIAIDIQRESDVGLGSLNQTRKALGLVPYSSFGDLTDDPVLRKNLKQVYGHIGALDARRHHQTQHQHHPRPAAERLYPANAGHPRQAPCRSTKSRRHPRTQTDVDPLAQSQPLIA